MTERRPRSSTTRGAETVEPSVGVPETPLSLLVRAALDAQPLTYEALSARSGIPVSTFSAYKHGTISGERVPRERLVALAKVLNIPEEDVLEAAGAAGDGGDEATLIKLYRRLPSPEDRAQAVESLRVHVRFSRKRRRK